MKFLDKFGVRSGGVHCDHEMINSWQDDEAGMKGAGNAAEAQSSGAIVRDLRGALAPAREPP